MLQELLEASEYLGFPQFQAYLTNIVRKEEYRNKEITVNYIQVAHSDRNYHTCRVVSATILACCLHGAAWT